MSFGIALPTTSGTIELTDGFSTASLIASPTFTSLSGNYTPPSAFNPNRDLHFFNVRNLILSSGNFSYNLAYSAQNSRFEWSFPSGSTVQFDILLFRVSL